LIKFNNGYGTVSKGGVRKNIENHRVVKGGVRKTFNNGFYLKTVVKGYLKNKKYYLNYLKILN
jgi:hypothetical protein